MIPAQTITAEGLLQSVAIEIKKYGSPVFNIRASIYLDEPTDLQAGFLLNNWAGDSTNVIAAGGLTTSFTTQTFYFNNIAITGKWTIVFTYESVTTHNAFNYAAFEVGVPAPGDDLYANGDFCGYFYDGDTWYVYTGYDLVFGCTYCSSEATTTTTTQIEWERGTCRLVTMTNTDRSEETIATFGTYPCEGDPIAIPVEYGNPVTECMSAEPVLLAGTGAWEIGEICNTTTTTLEVTTTTTTEAVTTTTTTASATTTTTTQA